MKSYTKKQKSTKNTEKKRKKMKKDDITNTEEAHHLNVSRNRRRTCELSVRVHTTQSIGHKANGY